MAGNPQGGGQPQQPNVFNQAAGAYNNAISGSNRAMNSAGYTPATASAQGYNAQGYQAGQFAGTDMQPYMNPYVDNVVNRTTDEMERARLMQQNQTDDAMQQAGAFGGSRHGVANAETNRGFYDRLGATTANLYNTGYQNAQQAAFQDIGNQMQADQFGAQAQNQANQYGAQAQNQASMFNAGQRNQANQAQFDNRFRAAQLQGQLANQGLNMGMQIGNQQSQQGAQAQQMNQQLIDAARQQYSNYANAGNLGLSPLAQFAGGNYGGTTTESSNPGILGTLGTVAGIAGAFCWVAREVYGPSNPEWLDFREWMLERAPAWLRRAYIKHGPDVAEWVKRNPWSKRVLRPVMDWLKG